MKKQQKFCTVYKILLDIPFMKINFGSNHPLNKFLDRVREYYFKSWVEKCSKILDYEEQIQFLKDMANEEMAVILKSMK